MTRKKVYLGKVLTPHGVKGFFKVQFYNNDFLNLEAYENKVYIDNFKINLEKKFSKGKFAICESKNHNSREKLKDLIGKELWIDEVNLKNTNENEYFHKDLLGCKVYDKSNNIIGEVTAIHNFGAGDLLDLGKSFNYMIRFYDLKKEDIDIKGKIIRLSKNYEL